MNSTPQQAVAKPLPLLQAKRRPLHILQLRAALLHLALFRCRRCRAHRTASRRWRQLCRGARHVADGWLRSVAGSRRRLASDHVQYCFSRYRSYRPEDNSYQL
ncbi:MAG: BA14K family protein [Mesorhizobium sp.]|nr:MAG: BA14K family protein [Mesorhizobium sp.]